MDLVEQLGRQPTLVYLFHLDERVGPFKLIRGDPGKPDGWIQPDKVVDEEGCHQEDIQSNNTVYEQVLLFHLGEDPYEKKNLAEEFPAITQYLARLLDKYQVKCFITEQYWLTFPLKIVRPYIWALPK